MTPLAQRTIEEDLERLERQRTGYALAFASSHDDRTRARHERTLSRLDDEIAATQQALVAMAATPRRPELGHNGGVPIVEHTTELEPAEYDELTVQPRRWLAPAIAAAAVVLGLGLWLALRPDPPPPVPVTQPPPVVVSSPVPPDSDAPPAR